jgi:hypothetical protein
VSGGPVIDLRTGVQLGLVDDPFEGRRLGESLRRGDTLLVDAQSFVEYRDGDGWERMGGSVAGPDEVDVTVDPTKRLLEIAHESREWHLPDLLGDLRRNGVLVSRWDFYAAPFRIELSKELQARVRQLTS